MACFSLGYFGMAGILGHFEGKAAEVERRALQVIDLSTRQSFAGWRRAGLILRAGRAALPVKMLKGLPWIENAIRDITV